jgi:ssDNA-binding Zn-finger/Zn-ribbon topoisomerase 1
MKKCPNCYAIMREKDKQTQFPGMPQLPSDAHPSNDVAGVRYECSQCGHCEDSVPAHSQTPVYR